MSSQYHEDYLAECSDTHRISISTFLNGVLRGNQKRYTGKYYVTLKRSLEGDPTVIRLKTQRGADAYVRSVCPCGPGAEEYQMKDVRRDHLITMDEIGHVVTKIVNDPVMDLLAPSIDLYSGVRGG